MVRSEIPTLVRSSQCAPVAQLDRASDYGSEGWEFESLRARLRKGRALPVLFFAPGLGAHAFRVLTVRKRMQPRGLETRIGLHASSHPTSGRLGAGRFSHAA